MKIYIDGKYYDREDAKISVFDHGLLYGDGVFEGIRIYNTKVFKLEEHIERLYRSAKAILLEIPMTKEEMGNAALDAVKINEKENGYIRLIVTRGEGQLGIDPVSCKKATVIIIVSDIQLYPEEYYKNGIEIVTASSRRIPSDGLDPRIKSLNYLNNIMAKLEARQAGCLEAVMLNKEGFVAECTGDNIFVVKGVELFTPAPYHGALDGITMGTVMEIAETLGITTHETTLTRYDLYNADECFMTGTGAEIIPVIKIDGRTIGEGKPGSITEKLVNGFKKLTSTL
ncbi:MAG: branched-chain-amino-acid transaminase [Nitrospiraceae bacterium]|jgi:branched-chain amino acid aminotransferase|nr:branched-chain-amino-acid transaminase [Nitrospiraceae bacterium]